MTATQQHLGRVRTRWAAIGAAVAVTLGAGGLSLVQAANGDGSDELVYVPLEQPCRHVDTRAAEGFQVGPRSTPLGAGEEWTIDANDTTGNCTGTSAVPTNAVALNANATGKNASAPTFLSLYPADNTEPPVVSNVNPDGTLATPNATTINLDADGKFIAYNAFGTLDIFIDIFGYYIPVGDTTEITKLWEKITELETKIENTRGPQVTMNSASLLNGDVPNPQEIAISLNDGDVTVLEVPIAAPEDGQIFVSASLSVRDNLVDAYLRCQINDEPKIANFPEPGNAPKRRWSGSPSNSLGSIEDFRVFPATKDQTTVLYLMCDRSTGGDNDDKILVYDPVMTAIFVENPQ